jgi:peroxiredoxin
MDLIKMNLRREPLPLPAARRRLLALGVAGAILIGGALAAYPSLRVRRLVREMSGDEHEGAESREKLVALLGPRAPSFFSGLLEHPDAGVRLQAAEALVELRGAASLPQLLPLMGDYNGRVRQRLVEEGAAWTTPEADRLVLASAADADLWVRQAAVNGLAERVWRRHDRRPQTLAALARAVDDEDDAARARSVDAMRAVAGRDFGYRAASSPERQREAVARWRSWWRAQQPRPLPALPPPLPVTRSAPAPGFSLADVEGKRWSLDALRRRPLLLHFFGTWCGPCQAEMPELESLRRERPDLVILGLGLAEAGPEALRRYAAERGLGFPLALAPDAVTEAYGDIHEVPVSFVIDGQGRIRRRFDGTRDLATFRAALQAIAPSHPPAP